MSISALTADYNLDPPDNDNPFLEDLYSEKENLEQQVRELQEKNAWLRYSLNQQNIKLFSVLNRQKPNNNIVKGD